MNFNLISAILVIGLILSAAIINVVKIKSRKVDPTLSTWVIILVAAILSFSTYLLAQNRDVVAGALNFADLLSTSTITLGIIIYGKTKWKLKPFEKFYLMALVAVCIFWFFTSDPFVSNLLLQVIISLGYIPTAHNLIKNRKNSESFVVWGLILAASIVSLYPAVNAWVDNGNVLSLVYTVRSIVLLAFTLSLMGYFESKNKRS